METKKKCFIPDAPFLCDHIYGLMWSFSVKLQHEMTLVSIVIVMETRLPEKLVTYLNGF